MADERPPTGATRFFLTATRVWLPLAIAAAGVVLIILGGAGTDSVLAGAGVSLILAGVVVWMINWMYRMSVQSNRDREREELAREYFDVHGRWPDEET
jgi:predicted phage tail protein